MIKPLGFAGVLQVLRGGAWTLLGALLVALPAWGQNYQLVWQDEFDGTQVDATKWQFQIGDGCPSLCGWGNNELQYYRSQNATVAGGLLTITAKKETYAGRQYTSARLRTLNRGDWTYGRLEMRAKMPIGQGIWPAFWMLPSDGVYGTWAASGEIDIVEYLGQQPNRVFGSLHYGGTYPNNQYTSTAYTLPAGNFNEAFHDFALEWEPCAMRWYVDGTLYATKTNWNSTGGPYPAPFDQRFHILLNLAVGGNLPGAPDATTVFPQQFQVDYVRVYQLVDGNACTLTFDNMDHANPFAYGWFHFGGSVGGGGIGANTTDLPPVGGCRASLQGGWGSGGTPGFFGGFGRTNRLNLSGTTHFTFWIHPDPNQTYRIEVNLQDDDNGDDAIPGTPDGADDEFQFNCIVSPTGPDATSGGPWQRVAIPLSSFVDDNSYHYGGNGIFDPVPVGSGGNGRLVNVVWSIVSLSGQDVGFRTDRWGFTRQTSAITGRIWNDADGDGAADPAETGINGVGVGLYDLLYGVVTATQTTSGDGNYGFPSLLGGRYEVRVEPATLPAGSAPSFDADGVATAHVFALDLYCDTAASEQHFGYALPPTDTAPPFPGGTVLRQNYPNPFNPRTVIEFELPADGVATLTVHDVAGRFVRTLAEGRQPGGRERAEWDGLDAGGREMPSGVYTYTLRTDHGRWVRRMTLLR